MLERWSLQVARSVVFGRYHSQAEQVGYLHLAVEVTSEVLLDRTQELLAVGAIHTLFVVGLRHLASVAAAGPVAALHWKHEYSS